MYMYTYVICMYIYVKYLKKLKKYSYKKLYFMLLLCNTFTAKYDRKSIFIFFSY